MNPAQNYTEKPFTFEGFPGIARRYPDGQTWIHWATLSCWITGVSPALKAKVNSLFD